MSAEPDIRLKRFLYLSSDEPRLMPRQGFPSASHDPPKSCIEQLIRADKLKTVLEALIAASEDPLLPNRDTLIFSLVMTTALTQEMENTRSFVYDFVKLICKSMEDLFLFIKFSYQAKLKLSKGFRRILRDFYVSKPPLELAKVVLRRKSLHGIAHKDIFKMLHIASTDNIGTNAVMHYLMTNLKSVQSRLQKNEKEDSEEVQSILQYISVAESFKHCEDEKAAAEMIQQHKFPLSMLPAHLEKSPIVWEAYVSFLTHKEIIDNLLRLHKFECLKPNTPLYDKIIKTLTDGRKVHHSKIQPIDVFVMLHNFEHGQKPMDFQKKAKLLELAASKLATNEAEPSTSGSVPTVVITNSVPSYAPFKNSGIAHALQKTLQLSFKNLNVTGRRFMICVQVNSCTMNRACIKNRNIGCSEAAAFLALSIFKTERDVTVGTYDGPKIHIVPLEKGMSVHQAQEAIQKCQSKYVLLSKAFDYAASKKKPIDVFIHILHSAHAVLHPLKTVAERTLEKPVDALKRYRKKMHLPKTKMIVISLTNLKLEVADGTPNILDIIGFSESTPKVIEALCRGTFQ